MKLKMENRGAVPSILGMGFMCKYKTPEGFHYEITSIVNKKTSGLKMEIRGAVPAILGMGFICKYKTPGGVSSKCTKQKRCLFESTHYQI